MALNRVETEQPPFVEQGILYHKIFLPAKLGGTDSPPAPLSAKIPEHFKGILMEGVKFPSSL